MSGGYAHRMAKIMISLPDDAGVSLPASPEDLVRAERER